MNDADRWINLEGPEPDAIRELLDAAREVPAMTPELEASLDRRLQAALIADRRRWARRRTLKRALGVGLLAACLASALVLAFRHAAPSDLERARRLLPGAPRSAPAELVGTDGVEPPARPPGSGTSPPPAPRP